MAEYGQPTCTGGQYRESCSYTAGGLPVKKKLWVYDGTYGVGSLVGEWSYDDEGKILTVKYPDTYDSQGNPLTGRTYTNGYDAMGRLATLVDNRPGDPPGYTWVQATTYNVAGQMTELRRDNMAFEQREYNERLQVTRINYPTLTDTHYYYPANPQNDGRITQRNVNGVNTMYTYDSLGRLATAGSASYTYDGFGNRVQQTSPAMYLTYNASNNRITSTGYSYDDNGNLTTMPNLTMSYDVENRLAQAQTPAVTENYRYAPSGQRVWKQKSGSHEWYFYGVDGRLIGTYVPCQYYGTLFQEQSTNVYFGGRTLQAQNGTGIKQDRLGTTSYTTTTYAPYGDTGISPPPYGDGLGFTGYYRDGTSTGLDYAQQRYYAPSIGRFTSPDPYRASAAIARPQSWNRYAYVENDPVNFVDPSGLSLMRANDPSVTDDRLIDFNNPYNPPSGGGNGLCVAFPSYTEGGPPSVICTPVLSGGSGSPGGNRPSDSLKPTCPNNKTDFYSNWGLYKEMADKLHTNVDFILALSALETGWFSSDAAKSGKNLFGASDAKENTLSYSSYQASADAWVRRWGGDVNDVSDATTFFQNLVDDGYNPHKGYAEALVKMVSDTRKFTALCVPDDWR